VDVPDSADSYLELVRAIDRERFAVHLDVVNLVCSPQRYFANAALNPRVRGEAWPTDQELPCQGYRAGRSAYGASGRGAAGAGRDGLSCTAAGAEHAGPRLPLMLEHLQNEPEYDQAASYVRSVAWELNVRL